MNTYKLAIVLSLIPFYSSFGKETKNLLPLDWSNPPVNCIENLVPKFFPCLDLSGVENLLSDLPPGLSESETKFWTIEHRADLALCRAKEVQRRETLRPGTTSKDVLEWAWMWMKQSEHIDEKINSIYETAENIGMPPQILFGALKQESLLSDLGITVDGSNFSCGIGQINLIEWCEYMRSLPEIEQLRLGWPIGLSCGAETLTTELVRPFYDLAIKKMEGRPDYELTPMEFKGITLLDVASAFPSGDPKLQENRFFAALSFVLNCSDFHLGIEAKGNALRLIFQNSVPEGLKKAQTYLPTSESPFICTRPYRSKYYPLHTGWLLADAIYNAGGREVGLLEYYFRMKRSTHESGQAWRNLSPIDLIEGLHWGGKWNPSTKKIEFKDVYGLKGSQSWYKSCVVQRHIANVIQYVALPGVTIAHSLEQGGCRSTTVPEYRMKSSGRRDSKKSTFQTKLR